MRGISKRLGNMRLGFEIMGNHGVPGPSGPEQHQNRNSSCGGLIVDHAFKTGAARADLSEQHKYSFKKMLFYPGDVDILNK